MELKLIGSGIKSLHGQSVMLDVTCDKIGQI